MRAAAGDYAARRPALPLGLTLGLHLLLVLAWLLRPATPARDDAARLVSVLIPVLAPRTRLEPVAPVKPQAPPLRVPAAVAPSPAMAGPGSAAPEPEPEPLSEPEREAPAPIVDPFAGAAPAPPSLSADSELLGRARRAAGPIDRTLRGGKSEVPKEADTPWARLQRAADAAHAAPIFAETRDRYTSPDGTVIYRARQGKRQTCRQSGSVNFLPGGASGANLAGDVPCPKGAQWDRY